MIPIVYDVQQAPVLVVGNRPGALRKAELAASFGARVRLVAPIPRGENVGPSRRADISSERGPYTAGYLTPRIRAAALVFVDTGDEAADRRVSSLARRLRVPVNVVDKPELCSFLMPAYVRGRRFALAITTFGKSPMASRVLREELGGGLGWFDRLVALLAEVRARLRAEVPNFERRRRLIRRVAVDPGVRLALAHGNLKAARSRAGHLLGVRA